MFGIASTHAHTHTYTPDATTVSKWAMLPSLKFMSCMAFRANAVPQFAHEHQPPSFRAHLAGISDTALASVGEGHVEVVAPQPALEGG